MSGLINDSIEPGLIKFFLVGSSRLSDNKVESSRKKINLYIIDTIISTTRRPLLKIALQNLIQEKYPLHNYHV